MAAPNGAAAGMYAQSIVGVIDLLSGAGADAAYEAAYGKSYSRFTGMYNAANQRVAAEANIAAITQDRINTDTVVAMKQDQAEAMAKVSAAVGGVEGQSVDSVIHQTKVNSSLASANNRKAAEQQIENQLATIYQSTSTMLALDGPSSKGTSPAMAGGKALAQIMGNPTTRGAMMEGLDGLFGSDTAPPISTNAGIGVI
jgi:hypothetical protein